MRLITRSELDALREVVAKSAEQTIACTGIMMIIINRFKYAGFVLSVTS